MKLTYRVLVNMVALFALVAGLFSCSKNTGEALTSPDKNISVKVFVTDQHTLAYRVDRLGQPVILDSSLGLQLTDADFSQNIKIDAHSPVTPVTDVYRMQVGKKRDITYQANE